MTKHYSMPLKKLRFALPADLCMRLEERLFDPALGKPIYGARSRLIVLLLRKWLDDPSIVPISIIEEGNDEYVDD